MELLIPQVTYGLDKKRKNQLFKWDFTPQFHTESSARLFQFLQRLGFEETDLLSCQLMHETEGFFLEGQLSVKQFRMSGVRSLSIMCNTAHYKNTTKYFRTENENGFGVFFAILGNRHNVNQKVRFHMVDVDFGKERITFLNRDEAEQQIRDWQQHADFQRVERKEHDNQIIVTGHYTKEYIKNKKFAFIQQHQQDLETAIIVETYQGLHIYYVVTEGDIGKFTEIQESLARKFGGDTAVKDKARIIRMPYFFHMKNPKDPFYVQVIHWGMQRGDGSWVAYTQEQLERVLDLETTRYHGDTVQIRQSEQLQKQAKAITKTRFKKRVDVDFTDNEGNRTEQLSFDDFLSRVKQLPFHTFLDNIEFTNIEGVSYTCLFHTDTHPSATHYRTESGTWIYKCFASTCHCNTFTIVDMVMYTYKVSFVDSVQYLSQLCGIEIVQTPFQRDVLDMIHRNFQWIKRNIECRNREMSEYPELYTAFSPSMKRMLKELMTQLLSYPIQESWSIENKPIFFASADYLATECQLTRKTIQQNLNLLSLFGFVQKLAINQVPKTLYQKGKNQQAVNYYTIQAFEDICSLAADRIQFMQRMKFSRRELTYDYLVLSFGQEVADEVFPNQVTYRQTQRDVSYTGNLHTYNNAAKEHTLHTVKRVLSKKKYVRETLLLKELDKVLHTVEGNVTVRKQQSSWSGVSAYLKTHGYVRKSLTPKVAKELNTKPQKPNERVYVWLKSS